MKVSNIMPFISKAGILFGLSAFYLTQLIGHSGIELMIFSAAVMVFLELLFGFIKGKLLNPYHFMLLTPLTLIHYSTIGDFKIRMFCFFLLVYVFNISRTGKPRGPKMSSPPAKPLVIWLMAFLIFTAASFLLYFQGVQLSGDEPHYIMVAQSIVEDHDFDLDNNIQNKTYYKYLPVDLQFHGKIWDGRYRSYHMPGVSFLLVPFYALFNLLAGFIPASLYFRLVAGLINACFGLALFFLLKIQFPDKKITGIWILFLGLYPLVFHSIHLYPELPAAALMMAAFIFAFGEKTNYWLSGFFLSSVAWFHVKYYPALIVLALFILIKIIKTRQIKPVLHFFIFPLANFLLLMLFCKSLYQTFNPAEIFPVQDYFVAPVILRVKVLLAYFLDQRDGLLFYSPVFFLMFLGFKNRLRFQNILLWIAVPYVGFHAFTTVRGAYSPAGRSLMFVSWIFIIWIANFYFKQNRDQNGYGFKLLTGLSVFVLFWLFYYPLFVYQPVFGYSTQRGSTFLLFMGSSIVNLWKFFPSFLTRPGSPHLANYIWIGSVLVFLILFYLKFYMILPSKKRQVFISLSLFLLLTYLFCFYPHVHLIPENRYQDEKISFFNNSRNFRFIPDQQGFNILAGNTYKIFLEPRSQHPSLNLVFANTDQVEVWVTNKTSRLFRSGRQKTSRFSIEWKKLKSIKIKNRTVFPIEIRTRTRAKQAFLFLQFI
ncbi:MAG: hypothetical protein KAS65_02750 [Candidatus Aminicenantes bacterium]|nr:hypothetical protein [Candidatus Aminicenantes bacterium]